MVQTLEPITFKGIDLVNDLIGEEREKIAKNEKIREFAEKENIVELVTKSKRAIDKSNSTIGALEFGYIPVLDVRGLIDIDTKNNWDMRRVKESMKDVPPEALEALEVARNTGVFDKVKVNTYGIDPILVGCAGGKDFLIASWLHLPHGKSVGIRYLPNQI